MDLPVDDVPLGLELKTKKKKHSDSSKYRIPKSAFGKRYRLQHSIKVTSGNDYRLPAPVSSFSKFSTKLHEQFLRNLCDLSFSEPTPVQAQSIPILLKRHHLLACAPTGSGKTAAYLLPILNECYLQFISPKQAIFNNNSTNVPTKKDVSVHYINLFGIILAPTQELVRQIWSEAVRLSRGLTDIPFIAYLSRRHYANRGRQKKKSADTDNQRSVVNHRSKELRLPISIKVLVTTPYRMSQMITRTGRDNPFDLSRLQWLIIDECDKMLETDLKAPSAHTTMFSGGRVRSFRDQLAPIFSMLHQAHKSLTDPTITSPTIALFSATVPNEVAEWTKTELPQLLPSNGGERPEDVIQLYVGAPNATVSTVKQELRYCGSEEGKLLEIRNLLVHGMTYPCLIFMDSRERAKEIVKEILLSDSDILANVISSEKTEAQRLEVMRAFREGRINVLVCTDLLGRGIDFKNVNTVLIYDVPASPEDYIHRVGRTGRAGQTGKAITLWTDADLPHLGEIIQIMRRSGSHVDSDLDRLVQNWHTRHSMLLVKKLKGRKSNKQPESTTKGVLISRRRGERRLIKNVSHNKKHESASENEPIKWLRRWKTHRRPISQLSGARQKKKT